MQIPFHLVDVFAECPLTGNPLAVFPQAEALDDLTMQQIAREFNQAVTTFYCPPDNRPRIGDYVPSQQPVWKSLERGTTRSARGGGWRSPAR